MRGTLPKTRVEISHTGWQWWTQEIREPGNGSVLRQQYGCGADNGGNDS